MKIEDIYQKSEKYISIFPLIWCVASIGIGMFWVKPAEAIVIPVMGLSMFYLVFWGTRFLLFMQKSNPFVVDTNILKYANVFLWGIGIFGAIYFLVAGVYFAITQPNYGIYLLMVWFFPLGVSKGVSKSVVVNA